MIMTKKTIITMMLALVAMAGLAQGERIDTVIPKFLSNGYFFREMPTLPDGEKTMSRLKDKEGNSVIVINVNATLPKSLIRKAIPRERVHNADQFLSGLNMMATVTSLTQAGVMFFSATYHDAETAKRITDKHHFTWTHLVEAKDMMAWIGYEGFPLTIVVDKKGIVRHAVHGTNETKREELLAKIKEAEAE